MKFPENHIALFDGRQSAIGFEWNIDKGEIPALEMIEKACDVRFLTQTNDVVTTIPFDDYAQIKGAWS